MRSPITAFSLTCLLVAPAAFAQEGPRAGARFPSIFSRPQPGPASAEATKSPFGPAAASSERADPKVFPASTALPTPTPPDMIKASTLVLPTEPVEPFLLTKDNGPFMVMAKTFRGPEAERFAVALVKELRQQFGLPAYIVRTKDFPNRSNIRNVPPLAPEGIRQANLSDPERVRSYDEAAVLVGDCKSLDESEALWLRVKKLKPKCLNEIPTIFGWRTGLSTAIRTTNPYVPTQNIYPGRGKRDHLLGQMNSGPRSVVNCPGRYTLQVAEFGGRAVFNPEQKTVGMFSNEWLRKSTLATAADDAERVADILAKDPEIVRSGFQPYVFHDRTSSKVLVGAFQNPADPAALGLRDLLLKRAVPLADKQRGLIIAPGHQLTDLENPDHPIKTLAQAK